MPEPGLLPRHFRPDALPEDRVRAATERYFVWRNQWRDPDSPFDGSEAEFVEEMVRAIVTAYLRVEPGSLPHGPDARWLLYRDVIAGRVGEWRVTDNLLLMADIREREFCEWVRVVPVEQPPTGPALLARVRELEAERDQALDALTAIRDHGKTDEFPCHAMFEGDCEDVMREVARAALSMEGKEPDA